MSSAVTTPSPSVAAISCIEASTATPGSDPVILSSLTPAARFFQRDLENKMIMWKRSHPAGTYPAYLLDEFPENVRCDGDGNVVWIDKRVRGPRWEGAFHSLAAADELHELGIMPRMGADMSPMQEVREKQQEIFLARDKDSRVAAAAGQEAVSAMKFNEATSSAQELQSPPLPPTDMWGREMTHGFGAHKVRSSIGLARGVKPPASVLGLNMLPATPPSPVQERTQDTDMCAGVTMDKNNTRVSIESKVQPQNLGKVNSSATHVAKESHSWHLLRWFRRLGGRSANDAAGDSADNVDPQMLVANGAVSATSVQGNSAESTGLSSAHVMFDITEMGDKSIAPVESSMTTATAAIANGVAADNKANADASVETDSDAASSANSAVCLSDDDSDNDARVERALQDLVRAVAPMSSSTGITCPSSQVAGPAVDTCNDLDCDTDLDAEIDRMSRSTNRANGTDRSSCAHSEHLRDATAESNGGRCGSTPASSSSCATITSTANTTDTVTPQTSRLRGPVLRCSSAPAAPAQEQVLRPVPEPKPNSKPDPEAALGRAQAALDVLLGLAGAPPAAAARLVAAARAAEADAWRRHCSCGATSRRQREETELVRAHQQLQQMQQLLKKQQLQLQQERERSKRWRDAALVAAEASRRRQQRLLTERTTVRDRALAIQHDLEAAAARELEERVRRRAAEAEVQTLRNSQLRTYAGATFPVCSPVASAAASAAAAVVARSPPRHENPRADQPLSDMDASASGNLNREQRRQVSDQCQSQSRGQCQKDVDPHCSDAECEARC